MARSERNDGFFRADYAPRFHRHPHPILRDTTLILIAIVSVDVFVSRKPWIVPYPDGGRLTLIGERLNAERSVPAKRNKRTAKFVFLAWPNLKHITCPRR